MHLWRRLSALLILAAFAVQAAVVYKWTDSDGVVHYSDQSVPGAEKITTTAFSRSGAPARPAAAAATPGLQVPKKAAARVAYEEFSIVSPAPEQTFFAAPVSVQLHLRPALDPNHAISLQLNGAAVPDQPADALQFTLNLPRGAYSLVATITDRTSEETQSTETVTFYVRQPSTLSPQHKTP
jgi:hypothetical protein